MVITLIISVAFVAAGTLVCGPLAFLGFRLGGQKADFQKAFITALMTTIVSGIFYGVLLRFIDKPAQPLTGSAFWMAVALGLGAGYLSIMKSVEVEPNKVPVIYAPVAIGLLAVMFVARTQGVAFRESQGYYRGYETIAYLNLPDPPDAMTSPEKAVDYYRQQYTKLRQANEDEGIGKIMTTATHWDVRWFLDNYESVTKDDFVMKMTGIDKVITNPNAKKALALMTLCKPLVGNIDVVKTEGKEAVVRMSSGQVVRLFQEGRNWKVRDWLGMRSVFEKNPAYEQETKALCERLQVPYLEFDPYFDEDEEGGSMPGSGLLAGGRKGRRAPRTGNAAMDNAAPGTLVDLSQQPQPAPPIPTPVEVANVPPPPAVPDASIPDAEPTPAPEPGPAPEPTPGPPPVPAEVPAPVQPTPFDPNAPPPTPTPTPMVYENVPVDTLWPLFFAAAKKIENGDPKGIEEFHRVISQDDNLWLAANYKHLSDMISSGTKFATMQESQLFVLKALLRNMPHSAVGSPKVSRKPGMGVAVAEVIDDSSGVSAKYVTGIVQESGRWVLLRLFFARDFVWVPQLAHYKRIHKLGNPYDEQLFLGQGFAPFQQYVQSLFSSSGYGGS